MSKYIELGDEILKRKWGSKWGLKKGIILSTAKGYVSRVDDNILFKNKTTPKDKVGYIYYGLVAQMTQYTDNSGNTILSTQIPKEKQQLYFDLARTKKMTNLTEKVEIKINDKKEKVNVNDINNLYKNGVISRETWLELLSQYKDSSKEYIYKGYDNNS